MTITTDIAAAQNRLRKAKQMVSDLCKPRNHPERRVWIMRFRQT
jgi:hypothetical protein